MKADRKRWWWLIAVICSLCVALLVKHPQITEMAQIALFTITAIYVVFVYEQMKATRIMADEARIEHEIRNKPSLIAYFDNPVGNLIELVFKNVGIVVAKDVQFTIEPSLYDFKGRDISTLSLMRKGVKYFAPRVEFRQVINTGSKIFSQEGNIPLAYMLTMQYKDNSGEKTYNEEITLDLEIFKDLKTKREDEIAVSIRELKEKIAKLK